MADKRHVKIVLFVGLSGSGKSSSAEYVAKKGIPRVTFSVIDDLLQQLQHLVDAGQHKIVVDGMDGWGSYVRLKRNFPGCVVTVSLLADRHIRIRRLVSRPESPMTESMAYDKDNHEVAQLNLGGVIAMSEYFLVGSNNLEELYSQIDTILDQEEFFTN